MRERTNAKIASVSIEKATVSTWRTKGVALVMVVVVFEGYRWGRGLGRTVGGRHGGKGTHVLMNAIKSSVN